MNKLTTLSLLLLSFTTAAFADQKATITCSNDKIILTEKSPYLGENSKYSQSLIILQLKNAGQNESSSTVYFLDVDLEGDVDSQSMIWTIGKNKQGGKFTLRTHFWKDIGDGTVIKEETTGLLSYNHGPLKGLNEKVNCIRE